MSKKKSDRDVILNPSYTKYEKKFSGTIEERLKLLTGYSQASDIPEPTYSCECTSMNGWVYTDEDTNTVKPCARCRPEAYERWASGAWLPSGTAKVAPTHTPTQAEKNRRDLL